MNHEQAHLFAMHLFSLARLGLTDESALLGLTVDAMHDYAFLLINSIQALDGTLVVALVYLERLFACVPECKLTALNYESLILSAILLASKVWDDYSCINRSVAKALSFELEDVNKWERAFLKAIGYNVQCTLVDFQAAVTKLFAQQALREPAPASTNLPRPRRATVSIRAA